jgi:hypothetical protein
MPGFFVSVLGFYFFSQISIFFNKM